MKLNDLLVQKLGGKSDKVVTPEPVTSVKGSGRENFARFLEKAAEVIEHGQAFTTQHIKKS